MANFNGLPHRVRRLFGTLGNHKSRVEFIDFLSKVDAHILNDIGLDQRKESMNDLHFF